MNDIEARLRMQRDDFQLDIDLNIPGHGVTALFGPSGCGKTSLLRAIAGLEPGVSGSLSVGGKNWQGERHFLPPHRRPVGYVFQEPSLFPHLNVRDNLQYGLKRLNKRQRRVSLEQAVELLGIGELLQRKPQQLSGGEQQRVAIARALAVSPALLLMDEPFSSLDLDLRERLGQEVADMLKANTITSILVTHDQNDAFAMGDKIGVMAEGRLLQWDTAYNLYHEPGNRFVADFIGNGIFLPAKVETPRVVKSEFGEFIGDQDIVMPPGSQVEVLIRPDDVVLDVDSSIRGQVVRKAFKGAEILYTLRFESGTIMLALFPSHANFAVGDNVGVRLEVDHLVTFEQASPGGEFVE